MLVVTPLDKVFYCHNLRLTYQNSVCFFTRGSQVNNTYKVFEKTLMEAIYNPQAIEASVQKFWTDNNTFKAVENPNKENLSN